MPACNAQNLHDWKEILNTDNCKNYWLDSRTIVCSKGMIGIIKLKNYVAISFLHRLYCKAFCYIFSI